MLCPSRTTLLRVLVRSSYCQLAEVLPCIEVHCFAQLQIRIVLASNAMVIANNVCGSSKIRRYEQPDPC